MKNITPSDMKHSDSFLKEDQEIPQSISQDTFQYSQKELLHSIKDKIQLCPPVTQGQSLKFSRDIRNLIKENVFTDTPEKPKKKQSFLSPGVLRGVHFDESFFKEKITDFFQNDNMVNVENVSIQTSELIKNVFHIKPFVSKEHTFEEYTNLYSLDKKIYTNCALWIINKILSKSPDLFGGISAKEQYYTKEFLLKIGYQNFIALKFILDREYEKFKNTHEEKKLYEKEAIAYKCLPYFFKECFEEFQSQKDYYKLFPIFSNWRGIVYDKIQQSIENPHFKKPSSGLFDMYSLQDKLFYSIKNAPAVYSPSQVQKVEKMSSRPAYIPFSNIVKDYNYHLSLLCSKLEIDFETTSLSLLTLSEYDKIWIQETIELFIMKESGGYRHKFSFTDSKGITHSEEWVEARIAYFTIYLKHASKTKNTNKVLEMLVSMIRMIVQPETRIHKNTSILTSSYSACNSSEFLSTLYPVHIRSELLKLIQYALD